MKSILILTKNILAETQLEQQLKTLGYEVFCSTDVLESILLGYGPRYFSLFEVIFISSTICDDEAKIIIEDNSDKIKFYRIEDFDEEEPNAESWKRVGVTGLIRANCPTKILRELLSEKKDPNYDNNFASDAYLEKNNKIINFDIFLSTLSAKEKDIFEILTSLNGTFITRDDLSIKLWGEVKASNLAQLSQIISRIRTKIEKNNLESSYLITNWRKGYALSKDFFQSF
ncbi:winged helix-turn-helix domain-containing protein [Enterococcus sp. LJL120]